MRYFKQTNDNGDIEFVYMYGYDTELRGEGIAEISKEEYAEILESIKKAAVAPAEEQPATADDFINALSDLGVEV